MISILWLFFNRTELVEGLSVDVNFYPQPQSMSDQNVIPIFQTPLLYNLCHWIANNFI